MFNPFLSNPARALEPVSHRGGNDPLGGIMARIGHLDSDDLLLMLIVYLIMKDGNQDGMWPLMAALIYCIL